MGFLLLIAFSIYGLGCMCQECDLKKTLDNRPASKDPLLDEPPGPESRAKRPASGRLPVRRGTSAGGKYRRAADEDTDDSEVSIDELEYMRHFFH